MTIVVLLVTAALTGYQFAFPTLLDSLQRSPDAVRLHEWWRFMTPIFIERGGWAEISLNIFSLILVGSLAEQLWNSGPWLFFYLTGGLAGEIAGLAWKPIGAGSSVAMLGLLGGVSVWFLVNVKTKKARIVGAIVIVAALFLTARHNIHGPALLVGVCAASLMSWRQFSKEFWGHYT